MDRLRIRGSAGEQADGQLSLPLDVLARPVGDPPGPPGRRRPASFSSPAAVPRWIAAALWRWLLRITLPVAGAATMVHVFPYHGTAAGVQFRVEATLFTRPGISANTTLGNWEFPHVDGLPVGVHLTPENVDLVTVAAAVNADSAGFAQRLQDGLTDQFPRIAGWLVGEALLGAALGLAVAVALNLAGDHLRGMPRRADEIAHRLRQLLAVGVVIASIAAYGALSFNRDWLRQSRLTGTLAAAQLFPGDLDSFYQQQSKVFDVLGSVAAIQAALQDRLADQQAPDTALRIMYISDMHLASAYPLVASYASSYDVDLIINTGDESEFGTAAELTPAYLDALASLTAVTPMLWLAGNHDSPQVQAVIGAIPGVTVLGSKSVAPGGYSVAAGAVRAFGLTIAGVPDPRVYGGPGAYGSDSAAITVPLERAAMKEAVAQVPESRQFDIFASHEPVATDQLRASLPGQIRQTVAGHTHAQNDPADLQANGAIDLVEGSTGAGGLDNIVRGTGRPPIEFSIESVGADCQFTGIVRFQIRSPQLPTATDLQAYGDDVTASTVYFTPQKIESGRTCSSALGIHSIAL